MSIIAAISMACLTVVAGAFALRMRRPRNFGISYLEKVSVSRQWLVQHQADDTQ
ncbi:MAG: hypothetical protein AB7J63_00430 [Vicinamibacterales bacterium]